MLFDICGSAQLDRIGWTAPGSDDAFLALDRNGNGKIENGKELFGNWTVQPPSSNRNGFIALAEFDKPANGGNSDGYIDPRDSVFPLLRLWQDVNHNGVSEREELKPFLSLGLARISLDYKESRRVDVHGNRFKYRSKVFDTRGAQIGRWAYDVFFVAQ